MFGPFFYYILLLILKLSLAQIVPNLFIIGGYFNWVLNKAPVSKANILFIISLAINSRFVKSSGIKTPNELFIFVFNVLMLPVILYVVVYDFAYGMTFQPYERLYEGMFTDKSCKIDQST